MCVAGGYIYVADGQSLKRASTVSGNWTTITSGAVAATIGSLCSDGTRVFIGYAANGVYVHDSAGVTIAAHTTGATAGFTFTSLAYANGRIIGTKANVVIDVSIAGVGTTFHTNRNSAMSFVGSTGGNGFIYVAGFAGDVSLIYKTTLTADSVALDACSVAAQLPYGEIVSSIDSYLGYIFIGTNNGVRMATTDQAGNLSLGSVIPTSGAVNDFTGDGRFVWFTWTNYDGVSSGLGRLDLSVSTGTNTPAFATDLMYTDTGTVQSVVTFDSKRVFSINGIGVVYENVNQLVTSGEIESGTYRWGIPDRKFVAKVDTRATPLVGSITQYLRIDNSDWLELNTWDDIGDTENSTNGTDTHAIEAGFKFKLNRDTTVTSTGPTMTRWMARAYVAPYRSQQFVVPILLHSTVRVRDKEYYYDVEEHQNFFDSLIESPRIVVLQIGTFTHSVIVDDVEWGPSDAHGNYWSFEGTLIVTLRSVEN